MIIIVMRAEFKSFKERKKTIYIFLMPILTLDSTMSKRFKGKWIHTINRERVSAPLVNGRIC